LKLFGFLMSKDREIAEIIGDDLKILDEKLLPYYFKNFNDFEGWLEKRAIDQTRTNSRLLKKALRLTESDDIDLVLKVNAATITDTYWFKPKNSNLSFKSVKFKKNDFSKLALYGDPDSFNKVYSDTPELTNLGSFEKCWKLVDGNWWLYKQANELELFSELFICEFGKLLGFQMAHYEKDGKYIKSLDFTQGAKCNLELANGIVGENEDYDYNFKKFSEISDDCARGYLEILLLDTLCFNMDRHTKNYGILRDSDSGQVLGMAPNFDNNIALISRGYPSNVTRNNDKLISLFVEFLLKNRKAQDFYIEMKYPNITLTLISKAIESVGMDVDKIFLTEFIINAYNIIKKEVNT